MPGRDVDICSVQVQSLNLEDSAWETNFLALQLENINADLIHFGVHMRSGVFDMV
jgi:hypothetical protein